jgi:long-chain acyl-CoA synthetase
MRGPFDAMRRWWKEGNGSGNGHAQGNDSVHGGGGNGRAALPGSERDKASASAADSPRLEAPPVEPAWFAQLDREGIPRTLRYPTTSLARIVDQAAERFGDIPALVYNNTRLTYAELLRRINRMAGGLSRLGVRRGDRVLLALPNCPEYVISFFAIQKLGAVLINAGPLMGADDLASVVALTNPRVVIGLDLQAPKLVGAAKGSSIDHFIWVTLQSYQTLIRRLGYQIKLWQGREKSNGSPIHHSTLAELMENAPAKPPTIEPSPDAVALLQPTSGTTGVIKLAQLSHRNMLANAMQIAAFMSTRDGQERVLTVLPMFHVYGLTTGLINPIFSAMTVVLMTRFDTEETMDVLLRERPTVFPMVPAICDALSNEIERRELPAPALPGLRACISGAAPLPREMAERFEKLSGARVVEGYGLSESSPVTHANPISRPRYGSIGLPMPDTHCRVIDLTEPPRDVAMGQPGELLVSGPQVMSGYFGNPEETRRALWTDEHGRVWLRTGDIVRMDEDGFFQVLDRKKDMIIRSGLKVYPTKVEKVLLTHARVADVAVIGRADPVHTEVVVAFVSLKPAPKPAGPPRDPQVEREALVTELKAMCREHLAPYEVPAQVRFIDAIPRSALGKVLKKELRQLPQELPEPTEPNKPNKPEKQKKAA